MKPLEYALSPIVKHRNIVSQESGYSDLLLIKKIRQQKLDVLSQRITPAEADLIKPEVLSSWIRSYNSGLALLNYNYGPIMEKRAFEEYSKERGLLLKAADPFICQLETLLCDSECIILLTDDKGVMLRVVEGRQQSLEKQNARFNLVPGSIWTESTVGTCAHTITINSKIPIQICGPEHYSETYEQISCSSAPIFDANYNLAGTLCLVTPTYFHQSHHSLALVVSMAKAMQKEFQLELKNFLLSSTLEASDDALITVNQSGIITHANIVAKQIFLQEELIGKKLQDLIGEPAFIDSILIKGKSLIDLDIEISNLDQKLILRLAQPILDDFGTNLGAILIFRKIRREKRISNPITAFGTKFTLDEIIGTSPLLKKSTTTVRMFAPLDANILIQGESGTGKEVYAQAIHNESRPGTPFIAVNCAAIPSTLIESELFGYEGGAFTGAERHGRPGKIELANHGTLFLDEIGDMPFDLQAVLLRVIEEKQIMRIGGSRYLPINFRLITATNKNLLELVTTGSFRQDLYYRLKVLEITIPPLRSRGNDIILLAQHFIAEVAKQQEIPAPVLSDLAMLIMLKYDWPGNVRQLENAILYAVTVCQDSIITPENLPEEITSGFYPKKENYLNTPDSKLTIADMEKVMIANTLKQTGNNISQAAQILKMGRSTLYRKIKIYKL